MRCGKTFFRALAPQVLEAEMEQLTGKDNKKARNAKSREVSDMKKTDDFVDAERVRTDFARALRLFCFLLPQYERNFTWTCDLV